jgi:Carboxypeptidase regulatory-like domain
MKSLHLLRSLISAFVVVLCFAAVGFAQETTGTINGTVTDPNGAVVSGAAVTITDSEKKVVVRTTTSNEEGFYSVPNLPSGVYDVSIEMSGFKKSLSPAVKVDVGQRRTLDVALETGNVSETVNVTASPVTVELSTPTASAVVTGDQAKELSLNNRNWVQLVTLAPGVSNDLADQVYVGTTNPEGQANTINIAVNGARSSQNTFTVDGADITDRGSNITIQAYPSVDSIGEFKVLRSLFPAESGRSGGGQVNIITRSGGNKFHGSAFEFIRNEAFNANNFLLNATTNPPFGRDSNGKAKRPPFRYNNYGFTLSGPVYLPRFGEGGPSLYRGNRTFFFFSNENRKDRRFSSANTVTVPDTNVRLGIFPVPVCISRTYLGETCTGANILPAGTPIPAGIRSPAAAAYIANIYNRLPLPNSGAVYPSTATYNLTTALPNIADFHQQVIKIDHSFSDRLSVAYRFQNDKIPTIDANSLFSNGSGLPGVSVTETNSPGKTHTFQTIYSLGSKTIIEGRFTYGYGAILSRNIGLISLENFTAPIILPFPNQRDRNPSIGNASNTAANGFSFLSSFGPYDNFSWKKNYGGAITRIFGNHTTKFGATFSQYRKNENALTLSPAVNEGLASSFGTTLPTGVTSNTLNQNLQRFANFLIGNVATFSQAHFDYTGDLRQKAFEAFGQDEWKARRNLTIYYGVRYSYFGSPYDNNGRLSNFDPSFFNASQAPQVTGAGNRIVGTGNFCNGIIVNSQNFATGPSAFNCTPLVSPYGKYVVQVDKRDLAPRFGVAWDPFGKGTTSIRMGYGIYHEQVLNGTYLQHIGTNPPYQETLTLSNVSLDNPAGSFAIPTAVQSIRSVQPDFHTPYMQHWQLELQHQLDRKTVVSVGYLGSKGTHLIGLTELNDLPAGLALNSFCAPGNGYYAQTPAPTLVRCQPAGYAFRSSATVTAAQGNPNVVGSTLFSDTRILDQLRPYRGYLSVVQVQPRYNSNYHSLQVSAQRRFSGSSQVQLAYTWAKNLTDSPNDRSTAPMDTYNTKLEKQRATLDRAHVLVVNYIYELPFFKSQHGFTGKVLGGWQASGIATYNSPLPFSPTTSNFDPAGLGFLVANPAGRPNLLCDPNEGAPHTRTQFFNTACFQANPAVADAAGNRILVSNTPGTAGRGIIDGPTTKRVDFTMTKNVRFGSDGQYGFQLRAEVFNIFNHTNFRTFGSLNITSSLFGTITGVRDPRTMQFGAKVWF